MLPSRSQQILFDSSYAFLSSTSFSSVDVVATASPDSFSQNVKYALGYLELIDRAAKAALAGIEQAFTPTAAADANPISAAGELASLAQLAGSFAGFLATSGVGVLPLVLPHSQGPSATDSAGGAGAVPPDEMSAERFVAALYARQRQLQENGAVVAGLLSAGTAGGDGARR